VPEEIRVHRKEQETSVEIFFIEAKEFNPTSWSIWAVMDFECGSARHRRGNHPLRLELTDR